MKKRMKKQLTRLIVRVSAILLSVWLILSCSYSFAALYHEKERAYNSARLSFSELTELLAQPFSSFFMLDEARKIATIENHTDRRGNLLYTDVTYEYDRDTNIIVVDKDRKQTIDFDDIINLTFTSETEIPEYREPHFGFLSFQHFQSSMTTEQYEKILSYLDNQPEGEEYYELLCTAFYHNDMDELIPKTVQIVSTRDTNKWYVQDTPVETFDLSPEGAEDLTLYRISYLNRNEIPEEFIRDTFGSSNLIEAAQTLSDEMKSNTDASSTSAEYYPGLLRESAFSYIYYDHAFFTATVRDYSGQPMTMEIYDSDDAGYDNEYVVYYATRINILETSKRSILTVAGALLIFFTVIGVILCVMMWRSMKVQLEEEQKRRDMTNALAHDIKTPLFILSGYAANLRENVQTEKRERYAEVIMEQSEEVNRRVNRMLELSRLDSSTFRLKRQEFDLTALAADLVKNYETLPDGKTIDFTADVPDGKCMIAADRELMRRAVEYLLDNAVKYSQKETVIHIRISDRSFEISNTVRSTSTDRPFSFSGAGIGLMTVDSILKLHGFKGEMKVEEDVFRYTVLLTHNG